MNMIKKTYSTFLVPTILTISVMLLAACESARTPVPVIEEHQEHSAEHDDTDNESGEFIEGAREIRIVATEWSFEPATIELTAGEAVNIVLVNEGAIEHEVEFEGLGLHLHALPGESARGVLTPEVAGDFELGCHLPGHYEVGMKGKVHVEEASTY